MWICGLDNSAKRNVGSCIYASRYTFYDLYIICLLFRLTLRTVRIYTCIYDVYTSNTSASVQERKRRQVETQHKFCLSESDGSGTSHKRTISKLKLDALKNTTHAATVSVAFILTWHSNQEQQAKKITESSHGFSGKCKCCG